MFSVSVVHSLRDDVGIAQDLIQGLRARPMPVEPSAALLFADSGLDHVALVSALRQAWPDLALVGGSSQGEISQQFGYQTRSSVLMLLGSDRVEFHGGLVRDSHLLDRDALFRQVAASLAGLPNRLEPALCLLFPDGWLPTDAQQVTEAFQQALPGVPLFGGGLSNDPQRTDSRQFYNGEVLRNAVPYLLLCGPVSLSHGVTSNLHGGWNPYGPLLAAEARGNRLLRIDRRPAAEFLRSGRQRDDGLFSIGHPLAVYEQPQGQACYYRDLIAADPEDGSVQLLQALPSQCQVRMAEPVPNQVLSSSTLATLDALDFPPPLAPAAGLWVSCVARSAVLAERAADEFRLATEIGRLPPIIGFHGYGAIAPQAKGPARYQVTSQCLLLFGERAPVEYSDLSREYLNKVDRKRLRLAVEQQRQEIEQLKGENTELERELGRYQGRLQAMMQQDLASGAEHRLSIREALLNTLLVCLQEHGGRLPLSVLKGDPPRINRIGLARLLEQRYRDLHGAPLGIAVDAVSLHLKELLERPAR